MAKRKALHGLGELQAEVMEIVWSKGEATVADVVETTAPPTADELRVLRELRAA